MLLMVVGVVLGVRAARNRLPMWAARTALAVGIVIAVTSNMAHAKTSSLAQRVGDAFAEQTR